MESNVLYNNGLYPLKVKVKSVSHVRLFATPWTVACQSPWSRGFSRQGYWSGLPFPSPGDLPDPGIKPWSPSLQADSLLSEPLGEPKKFVLYYLSILCPWNSPSKNTRVGSCSLLQGIFLTQGLNPGLLPCGQILYSLSHQGSLCTLFIYLF